MFYVSIDIFNQMFLRFPSAHKERDLQVLRFITLWPWWTVSPSWESVFGMWCTSIAHKTFLGPRTSLRSRGIRLSGWLGFYIWKPGHSTTYCYLIIYVISCRVLLLNTCFAVASWYLIEIGYILKKLRLVALRAKAWRSLIPYMSRVQNEGLFQRSCTGRFASKKEGWLQTRPIRIPPMVEDYDIEPGRIEDWRTLQTANMCFQFRKCFWETLSKMRAGRTL
jgi:hypothetical protein